MTDRVIRLLDQIKATALDQSVVPVLAMSCHNANETLAALDQLNSEDQARQIFATAEIFRHTAQIYVLRILHPPETPLSDDGRDSIDSMFELLAQVPDALGPGSNLGWCLTVLGAELDDVDQREYVRHRLRDIRGLGMNNPLAAEKTLEIVWQQRDLHILQPGTVDRWQDIMRNLGEEQILV